MESLKELLAEVCHEVWRNIDWERVSPSRRMRVYDEMTTKLRRAARVRTVEDFVSRLCNLWGVASLGNTELLRRLEALTPEGKEELLRLAREDAQYIIWLMRARIEEGRESHENG